MSTGKSANLTSDVYYSPSSAWHTSSSADTPCSNQGHIDRWTTTPNASAWLTFYGNRVVVTGIKNNASGILQAKIDSQVFTQSVVSSTPTCDVFVDINVASGSHVLTLSLYSGNTTSTATGSASSVSSVPSELHLLDISYFTAVPSATTTAPASIPTASSKSTISNQAILGISLASAGGFILIVVFLLWYRRRKRREGHTLISAASSDTRRHSSQESYSSPNDGMAEHRTLTTISYGRTLHTASDGVDDIPLVPTVTPSDQTQRNYRDDERQTHGSLVPTSHSSGSSSTVTHVQDDARERTGDIRLMEYERVLGDDGARDDDPPPEYEENPSPAIRPKQ